METLVATLAIITVPIAFLNSLGGIIAGIWLIIVGKWLLVISAVFSTIVSTWVLGFLMAPTLLLAAPLAWEPVRKRKSLVFIIGALSNLWTYTLMLLYGVGCFIYVFNNYEGGIILPYLLIAYAVSTGPWTYMAAQESRGSDGGAGVGTTIPVFGVCIASIVMMGDVLFYGSPTFTLLAVTAAIPLALTWLVQMIVIISMLKQTPETVDF